MKHSKKLIIFSFTKLEDMLKKGNISYVRYYEEYFDKVYVFYLGGNLNVIKRKGKVIYISKNFNSQILNIITSPFKLYKLFKKLKTKKALTADMIFAWYTTFLLKSLKVKTYLMPVAIPSEIYKTSAKTMTGVLPYWIENIFIKLSLRLSDYILISKNSVFYIDYLNLKSMINKILIPSVVVDELPNKIFYQRIEKNKKNKNTINIVYVGRLHSEKLVTDMIYIFSKVEKQINNVRLFLIGNGEEEKLLKKLIDNLHLSNKVFLEGYKNTLEVKDYLDKSDIFISPLTGTSLREAFFRKIPVVAYNIDWIKTVFEHKTHLMKAELKDYDTFSENIILLLKDKNLKNTIVDNAYSFANSKWGLDKLKPSLEYTFDRD